MYRNAFLNHGPQGRTPEAANEAFKIGRTTGFTRGLFSSVQATIRYAVHLNHDADQKIVTSRFTVVVSDHTAAKPDFGCAGDSGSAVFDHNIKIAGMYWGGSLTPTTEERESLGPFNEHDGVHFVCPVKVLLEDMARTLGQSLDRVVSVTLAD